MPVEALSCASSHGEKREPCGEVEQWASVRGLTVDAGAAATCGPPPQSSAQTAFEVAREGWAAAGRVREDDEDARDAEDLRRGMHAPLDRSNAFDEEEGQ
ncbi:hypothetical protein Esti_003528 [Eimeria stiedai]